MALEGKIIVMIVICSLLFSSYISFQIFNVVTLFRAARRSRQGDDPELANNSNTPPPQTTELEKLPPGHFSEANTSFLNPRPPPVPPVTSSITTPHSTTQPPTTWSPLATGATTSVRHPIPAQASSSHNGRPCTNPCYADPFDLEELVSTPQFLPRGDAYSPPGLFASPPRSATGWPALRERRLTAMPDVRPYPASSSDGSVSPIAPDDAFSIGSDCGDDDEVCSASYSSDGSTAVIPCNFSGVSGEISPPPPAGLEEEEEEDDDDDDDDDDDGNDRVISGLENAELKLALDDKDIA